MSWLCNIRTSNQDRRGVFGSERVLTGTSGFVLAVGSVMAMMATERMTRKPKAAQTRTKSSSTCQCLIPIKGTAKLKMPFLQKLIGQLTLNILLLFDRRVVHIFPFRGSPHDGSSSGLNWQNFLLNISRWGKQSR